MFCQGPTPSHACHIMRGLIVHANDCEAAYGWQEVNVLSFLSVQY